MGAPLEAMFRRSGIYELRYDLAVANLVLVLLFLWPRTMTLGLLLDIGYWGGATATALTHGDYRELPIHVAALALLSIASFFRHPQVWTRLLDPRTLVGASR